jgi:hypothetical protein
MAVHDPPMANPIHNPIHNPQCKAARHLVQLDADKRAGIRELRVAEVVVLVHRLDQLETWGEEESSQPGGSRG